MTNIFDIKDPIVKDYLWSDDSAQEIAKRHGFKSVETLKNKIKKIDGFSFESIDTKDDIIKLWNKAGNITTFYRASGLSKVVALSKVYKILLSEEILVELYVNKGLTPNEIIEYLGYPIITKKSVETRIYNLRLKHKPGQQSELAKRTWQGKSREHRISSLKKTNNKRYGVDFYQQTDEYQQKKTKTMLERYGVEHALQNKDIYNKRTDTMLERFGVANPYDLQELKDKARETMLEKYGVENSLCSPDIYNKMVEGLKEKYGVSNVNQIPEVREKQQVSRKASLPHRREENVYWNATEYVSSKHDALQIAINKEKLRKFVSNLIGELKYRDHVSRAEVIDALGFGRYFGGYYIRWDYVPDLVKKIYRMHQTEVHEFVASLIDDSLIVDDSYPFGKENKQIDIYVPSRNFGMEFNGNFWHSDDHKGSSTYHLDKTITFRELNVNIMHIWEYDWDNPIKRPIIESQIRYHLNKIDKNNRYYARKLEIRKVSYKDKKDFLDLNHIQGDVVSSENYGLYDGNNLLSIMTFGKRRFDNKGGWELLRFANKINTTVAGGASKLLHEFVNNHKGEILISYANNDFAYAGEKSLYSKLGFTYVKTTVPGYKWVNTDNVIVSRYKVQPWKLKEYTISGKNKPFYNAKQDFTDEDTENSYMKRHNYYKIHDAGNDLYELEM